MEYKARLHYMKQIEPFVGQNLIKVITGQRRTGKSYFLFQIMDFIKEKYENNNLIFISKEYNEFSEIITYSHLIDFTDKHKKANSKNFLFIDEIQDIQEFEKALRHFQAKNEVEIFCTGSNSNMLSGELATYLSGRYIEVKMYGLSYPEFLLFNEISDSNEALQKYFSFGGLPYIIHLKQENSVVNEYLSNIYNTILYKDIISRWNIRSTSFLENLISYLANNTGNLISARRISEFLKSQQVNMSTQIVLNYLDYLLQAFFIFKVKRIGIEGRKIFEINEKYYFEDIGIRNVIAGNKQQHINQMLENVVYIHLRIAGYNVFVGQMQDKEIDFVAEKDNQRIYVQVAYLIADESVKEREFGNLLAIKDNYPKLVVTADEFTSDFQGIRHINIRKFLQEILK